MFRSVFVVLFFSHGFCSANVEEKIINGSPAQLRQFPYAASIRRVGSTGHIGGGALISDSWILTAKSVTLFFSRPNDLAVALGILNIANTVVAPGMVSTATAITMHPDEDLALVRIFPIACNAQRFGVISPIFLESRRQIGSVDALVAGWGATDINKEPSSVLRFLMVSTLATCAIQQTTTTFEPTLIPTFSNTMLPTESTTWMDETTFSIPTPPAVPSINIFKAKQANQDNSKICTMTTLCTTDIGGPLVTTTGLIGIATSTDCGGLDTFVRISTYRIWISAITGI